MFKQSQPKATPQASQKQPTASFYIIRSLVFLPWLTSGRSANVSCVHRRLQLALLQASSQTSNGGLTVPADSMRHTLQVQLKGSGECASPSRGLQTYQENSVEHGHQKTGSEEEKGQPKCEHCGDLHLGVSVPCSQHSHGHTYSSCLACRMHTNGITMKKPEVWVREQKPVHTAQ